MPSLLLGAGYSNEQDTLAWSIALDDYMGNPFPVFQNGRSVKLDSLPASSPVLSPTPRLYSAFVKLQKCALSWQTT